MVNPGQLSKQKESLKFDIDGIKSKIDQALNGIEGGIVIGTVPIKYKPEIMKLIEEKPIELRVEGKNIQLYLQERPSLIHEASASKIHEEILFHFKETGHFRRCIYPFDSADVPFKDGGIKQPDKSYAYRTKQRNVRMLAIEVEYHNKSFEDLIEEAKRYHEQSDFSYLLGLKIFRETEKLDYAVVFLLFDLRNSNELRLMNAWWICGKGNQTHPDPKLSCHDVPTDVQTCVDKGDFKKTESCALRFNENVVLPWRCFVPDDGKPRNKDKLTDVVTMKYNANLCSFDPCPIRYKKSFQNVFYIPCEKKARLRITINAR